MLRVEQEDIISKPPCGSRSYRTIGRQELGLFNDVDPCVGG